MLAIKFLLGLSPLFESYLRMFQTDEPLVHILYSEMRDLLTVLMKRFIKPSVMEGKSMKELLEIDAADENNQVEMKKIDFGKDAQDYLVVLDENQRKQGQKAMKMSYESIVKYLQQKLPLQSTIMRDISCLSPLVRECEWTVNAIGRLASLLPHVLSKKEMALIKDEWRLYQIEDIQENWFRDTKSGKMIRVDEYWQNIFEIRSANSTNAKYPCLRKVVKTLLSLPNGNADVERSLSDNKNTLTAERTNLKEETLVALRRAKAYARDCGGAHKVDVHRKGKSAAV